MESTRFNKNKLPKSAALIAAGALALSACGEEKAPSSPDTTTVTAEATPEFDEYGIPYPIEIVLDTDGDQYRQHYEPRTEEEVRLLEMPMEQYMALPAAERYAFAEGYFERFSQNGDYSPHMSYSTDIYEGTADDMPPLNDGKERYLKVLPSYLYLNDNKTASDQNLINHVHATYDLTKDSLLAEMNGKINGSGDTTQDEYLAEKLLHSGAVFYDPQPASEDTPNGVNGVWDLSGPLAGQIDDMRTDIGEPATMNKNSWDKFSVSMFPTGTELRAVNGNEVSPMLKNVADVNGVDGHEGRVVDAEYPDGTPVQAVFIVNEETDKLVFSHFVEEAE